MSIFVDIEKNKGDFQLKVKFSAENETIALLGASGCGKTMTLKCIAGIEKPDRGRIILDGVTIFDSEKRINLTPQQRHIGLLFQNYALFPNMTVRENIEAGSKRERNIHRRTQLVESVISSFGLSELLGRYPHQLSGGQQQRVALARILVSDPHILLLDEPFSALDSHLHFQLEQEVRNLIHAFGKTVVYVSHNREEVYRMADKIAVMHTGKIETIGSKTDVFSCPKTLQTAILTGCKNISRIEKLSEDIVYALDWGVELDVGKCQNAKYVGIRMHDLVYGDIENCIDCQVIEVVENPFSNTVMLQAKADAQPFGWEVNKEFWNQVASNKIKISFPKGKINLLNE